MSEETDDGKSSDSDSPRSKARIVLRLPSFPARSTCLQGPSASPVQLNRRSDDRSSDPSRSYRSSSDSSSSSSGSDFDEGATIQRNPGGGSKRPRKVLNDLSRDRDSNGESSTGLTVSSPSSDDAPLQRDACSASRLDANWANVLSSGRQTTNAQQPSKKKSRSAIASRAQAPSRRKDCDPGVIPAQTRPSADAPLQSSESSQHGYIHGSNDWMQGEAALALRSRGWFDSNSGKRKGHWSEHIWRITRQCPLSSITTIQTCS